MTNHDGRVTCAVRKIHAISLPVDLRGTRTSAAFKLSIASRVESERKWYDRYSLFN